MIVGLLLRANVEFALFVFKLQVLGASLDLQFLHLDLKLSLCDCGFALDQSLFFSDLHFVFAKLLLLKHFFVSKKLFYFFFSRSDIVVIRLKRFESVRENFGPTVNTKNLHVKFVLCCCKEFHSLIRQLLAHHHSYNTVRTEVHIALDAVIIYILKVVVYKPADNLAKNVAIHIKNNAFHAAI